MSGGVVVFNYTEWTTLFPELAYISSGQAQIYFNTAQQWCDNTACSPVVDFAPGGQRDTFLNFITAHLAALLSPAASGAPASPLVGRISNATEGSVSVATDLKISASDLAQFFAQTRYGLMYWTMSAQYRKFLYSPRPFFPGGQFGYGRWPGGYGGRGY